MGQEQSAKSAPVKVQDRRLDVRFVGAVSGCYTLSSRRSAEKGAVEVFACRSQSISPTASAVTAPVPGALGEWLTAKFDGLGIIRGQIERHIADGFVFKIEATDEERIKLAARIDWLKKRSIRVERDKREHKRFQPRDPRSTVTLADGQILRCFVIDVSRSGAAISVDHAPAIGSPLILGTLPAKVVRYLDVGFAVQYDAVQETEGLEQLVAGYEPKKDVPAEATA